MPLPKRKRLLFPVLAAVQLVSGTLLGQKVDLDRFHFDVAYIQLPQAYVEPASRTFGVHVNSSPTVSAVVPVADIHDRLTLSGYQQSAANPTVGITVSFGDVRFLKTETLTRTEDRKDKDGKVTGQLSYYSLKVTYNTTGSYIVTGPEEAPKVVVEQPKQEKTNRFLTAATVKNATDEPNRKTVLTGSLSQFLTATTPEYGSAREASKYFELNQASIRTNLISDYVDKSVSTINQRVNSLYGFVPVKTREYLWILDSKKHPEYPVQQEAIKAVKELMNSMSATQPIETLARQLQPVMDYFQALKTSYKTSDKQDRKMRYSAYYNLAVLNYLLDRPAKTIEEANGLIANDYDTADGRKYLELANELQQLLDKHKLDSRHMTL